MELQKAIKNRRTIRLFKKKEIPSQILYFLIDQARLAPSAMNKQPLEYLIVKDKEKRKLLFENIIFGGQTNNQDCPPTTYVIVLSNNKNSDFDVGLAVQNIVLSAYSKNIGSCIMGAINRDKIRKIFNIPCSLEIKLVIALGYPNEKPVIKLTNKEIDYKRIKNTLVVPKRKLKDIVFLNHYEK